MLKYAALGALVILLASAALRVRPPTYSVGDEALLEIYTLHAARGRLEVGAYSRFLWNHPGPVWFYAFAPGYAVSGHREDSLFVTSLVLNVLWIVWLMRLMRQYGGSLAASVAALGLCVFYLRPGQPPGWDFGDLLGSSWNPHTPMLPLALLMVATAVVLAGHVRVLPVVAGVGSVVAQAHVGLVPISAVLVALAFSGTLAPVFDRWLRWLDRGGRVSSPARVLDVLTALYLIFVVWVGVSGGGTFHLAGLRIRLNSTLQLVRILAVLIVVRNVLDRRHPRIIRWLAQIEAWRAVLGNARPVRQEMFAALRLSALVLACLWALPVIQQIREGGAGNLTQLAAFAREAEARDPALAAAAFTTYLVGPLHADFAVAAGGHVIRAADATMARSQEAAVELLAVAAALALARVRRKPLLFWLSGVCLVSSGAAFLSLLRVQGEMYDHIAFWISIVGLVNLIAIAWGAGELLEGRWTRLRVAPWIPALIQIGAVLGIGTFGAIHLVRGHQQHRFRQEVDALQVLSSALERHLAGNHLSGHRLLVEVSQPVWSIGAGLVLELYKDERAVSVSRDLVPMYGSPLAPSGLEDVEVRVTSPDRSASLHDEQWTLAGSTTDAVVYVRGSTRSTRSEAR
jgi:hypothetical protein